MKKFNFNDYFNQANSFIKADKNPLKKINKSVINFLVNSNSYNIIKTVHMMWLLPIVDCLIGTSEYEPG